MPEFTPRSRHHLLQNAPLFLAGVFVLTLCAGIHLAQAAPDAESEFAKWDRERAEFYEAHPELKTTPGGGWKPYNRIKWFIEQRMVDGQDIPHQALWNAWQQKKAREAVIAKTSSPSWFFLGPNNFAGRMLDIKYHPSDTNIIYAGAASGGLWRSTNGGLAWVPLTDELPTLAVGAIGIFPADPNIIIMGTGEASNNIDRVAGIGLMRSTDAGASWSVVLPSDSTGTGFDAIEVNTFNNIALAASLTGLWRSTDLGVTWERTSQEGRYTDVKWMPGSADTVYFVRSGVASAGNRIRRSTNAGDTWTAISTGLPTFLSWGKTKIAVTAANTQYIYALIADINTDATLGLYRTTDGGTSWTARNTTTNVHAAQGWYNASLTADPDNAERVIAGGTPLFRSNNGGTTLTQIGGGVHVDHHASIYKPGANNTLLVGTDGGIWESTDDGTSWSDRNTNLGTYQFYDICVSQPDPLRSWGGTQDNGTDRWVNSTTWLNGLGADGMVCNGHPTDANTVYGEIQFGDHRKSVNSGASWFSINSGISGTGEWVTPVEIDPTDGNHLYTSTSNGTFRTTDGGASWVNVDAIGGGSFSVSAVDNDVVWSLAGPGARLSTDHGTTWGDAAPFGLPVGGSTRIVAHPTDVNTAVVAFSGFGPTVHLARTTDLGVTWEDRTGDFPSAPINALVIDPQNTSIWFIGTDIGVWVTINEGTNWVPFDTGLPNAVMADLEIQNSSRKLRAGTHGRGMWEVDISNVAATGVTPGTAEPINVMFDPPSPNPVRGETILRYAAREHGQDLTLSIYDVQGRLVETLARHAADGLIRQYRWSAVGRADGVYFAVVRVGELQRSQKLVVVK